MNTIFKFWMENDLLTIIVSISFGLLGWLVSPFFWIGIIIHLGINLFPMKWMERYDE